MFTFFAETHPDCVIIQPWAPPPQLRTLWVAGCLVPRQAVSAETPCWTCTSVEQQGLSERSSNSSRRRTELEPSLREGRGKPQAPEGLDRNQPTSHILPWGRMFMIYRLQFSWTPIMNNIKRPKGWVCFSVTGKQCLNVVLSWEWLEPFLVFSAGEGGRCWHRVGRDLSAAKGGTGPRTAPHHKELPTQGARGAEA